MRRRQFLSAGAIAASVPLAGCWRSDDPVVEQSIEAETSYDLEFSAGDEVTVEVEVEDGQGTVVELLAPDGSELLRYDVFRFESRTVEIEADGSYSLTVTPDVRSWVQVTVD